MMELSNVLFSAKYWFNLDGQANVVTGLKKMLTATQNINANGKYQRKITKETLISKLCCSCARLLVHRFIFSVLLGNIRDRYVVDENIFFLILFVWQENDFGF